MMLTAHDDGFFGTSVNAEAAVDATHHVDIKARRKLFNFGIGMLACLNINTFGRTDRRTHITRDAFQAAVVAYGENMRSAKSFRIRAGLFRIINRRDVALEQAGEQPPQRHGKGSKGRPNRGVFPPGSFADVNRRDIDRVTALYGTQRSTSSCTGRD